MRAPIVRTWALARTYRRGHVPVPVLRGVDLEVHPGEWVAMVGPSGSGKSTLLNILGLLDQPDAGVYQLAGQDVSDLPDGRRAEIRNRSIGFVFQRFNLLARTTAMENAAAPLLYRGRGGPNGWRVPAPRSTRPMPSATSEVRPGLYRRASSGSGRGSKPAACSSEVVDDSGGPTPRGPAAPG